MRSMRAWCRFLGTLESEDVYKDASTKEEKSEDK